MEAKLKNQDMGDEWISSLWGAGKSAFPTNLGGPITLHETRFEKEHSVSEQSAHQHLLVQRAVQSTWIWWHLNFLKKLIKKLSNSLHLWKINMAD